MSEYRLTDLTVHSAPTQKPKHAVVTAENEAAALSLAFSKMDRKHPIPKTHWDATGDDSWFVTCTDVYGRLLFYTFVEKLR